MGRPQEGIFAEGSAHHVFLEYEVDASADAAALKSAVRGQTGPADGCQRVIAFGEVL